MVDAVGMTYLLLEFLVKISPILIYLLACSKKDLRTDIVWRLLHGTRLINSLFYQMLTCHESWLWISVIIFLLRMPMRSHL